MTNKYITYGMASTDTRRIDIDILRAIAVLAVILFHFEVPGFSGGFLGVDIFFVISGYLITLHINEQLATGEFQFSNFYLRRIRRLFPAIFVTLILTSIASLFILPKSLLQDFSLSQLAASTYISNIWFWSIADYFDTESIVKPLLHTWSLSVEEQFYLVWPLFIFAIFRVKQGVFIAAVGAASLIAAEVTYSYSPSTAFFHFPFRIFEFAIGAMAGRLSLERVSDASKNLLFVLSGIGILASIYLTTEGSRNPGALSLPLCLGVAVIICLARPWANAKNIFTTILVRIGLISYSAYLVHWPLLVFYKTYHPEPLAAVATCGLLLATYLLAELLFNFVERPALKVPILGNKLRLALLIPGVFSFALAFYLCHSPMYRWMNPGIYSVTAILDRIPDRKIVLSSINSEIDEAMRLSPIEKTQKIVVIGDSHSVDVYLSLKYLLADTEYEVENMHSICDPLTLSSIAVPLGDLYKDHGQDQVKNPKYCQNFHQNFIANLTERNPDYVIFSEAWRAPALSYISQTVSQLKEAIPAEIMLLGKNPIFAPHPNVVFRKMESAEEINSLAWSRRYQHLEQGDEVLAAVAKNSESHFISKNELLCPIDEVCEMVLDGHLGMVDSNHWSLVGMKHYGRKLIESRQFQAMIIQKPCSHKPSACD